MNNNGLEWYCLKVDYFAIKACPRAIYSTTCTKAVLLLQWQFFPDHLMPCHTFVSNYAWWWTSMRQVCSCYRLHYSGYKRLFLRQPLLTPALKVEACHVTDKMECLMCWLFWPYFPVSRNLPPKHWHWRLNLCRISAFSIGTHCSEISLINTSKEQGFFFSSQ